MVAGFVLLATACGKVGVPPAQVHAQAKDSNKTTDGFIHIYPEWLQAPTPTVVFRKYAIGFSIGSKGYMGGGEGYLPGGNPAYAASLNDFWQYDPSGNTWTQAASMPLPLERAATFVIGTQGYVATGQSFNNNTMFLTNTLYQYDQASNTWTQKANFPGKARCDAVGTTIGSSGYVGTGSPLTSAYFSDWYQYYPPTDQWFRRADLPGPFGRSMAGSFSIGLYGYITCGEIWATAWENDLWCYDPYYDHWQQEASLPASARVYATGFNYGSYGALIGGQPYEGSNTYLNDFWYYDQNANAWHSLLSTPAGRSKAVGFTINGTPYVGTGETAPDNYNDDFWYMTYVIY
jgi:N-acetylneuraminic acid mutarotase